jgi:tetratricopeptide (TPR) repeat protein
VLADMKRMATGFDMVPATAYALAAAEGRLALERQDWERAVTIMPLDAGNITWNDYPEYKAQTQFAVALGAARNGSTNIAESALAGLQELKGRIKDPYWADQVDIQTKIVNAWLAFARGSMGEAVQLMSHASEMEWATQKHPITPGELLPARELYGDMLLELDLPKEALVQYEMSLQRSPQRLNSLFGAALAAQLSADEPKAMKYFQQFVQVTSNADETLTKKLIAERYLKMKPS